MTKPTTDDYVDLGPMAPDESKNTMSLGPSPGWLTPPYLLFGIVNTMVYGVVIDSFEVDPHPAMPWFVLGATAFLSWVGVTVVKERES